jgi:chromosome segregation ATPase
MMAGVIRFLLALLLGFVAGVGASGYLVQSGAGDLVIRRTPAVQDLQRRLEEVEQQRNQLARQLTDVVERSGRMETSFSALEKRFHELETQLEQARTAGAPRTE